MDERSDRGEFYPGGSRSDVPSGTSTDKVDRVNLGEIDDEYTLRIVKQKVNQIVRAIAPVAVCIALAVVRLMSYAATAPLEDIPNTAPVVTNEEDTVAMAALTAATNALELTGKAAFQAASNRLDSATNVLAVQMAELRSAESNRVDATYAKRSEIPAAPDLAPYALKSELPQDYLVENDITNFATRAWINSQNYAREGTVYTRLDAQDLAIAAATNAQNAAIAATSNRVTAATNRLWQAVGSESNRLDSATNEVWQSALRADETLQREIDALRIVAADSNAVTRLVTQDGTIWQDATGTVWHVQDGYGEWSWTIDPAVAGADFYIHWGSSVGDVDGWFFDGAVGEHGGPDYYLGGNSTSTNLTYTGDFESTTNYTITFSRPVIHGGATNAIDRVAYTNDVAEAIWQLADQGTVRNAEQLVDTMTGDSVTARDVINATNYTDRVASEFEDGTRTVMNANNAGSASSAGFADKLSGDEWYDQYNANDLIRASTNAAKAVVGPATNAVLQAALGAAASKQDALPYPTNAIPYAAIDGAPSGGGTPEWREQWGYVSIQDAVFFITNGIFVLDFDGATQSDTVTAGTNAWPNGAAMFVRGANVAGPYQVAPYMRLVGYGTWPTNDFQSVWWRSGTTIYVNILLEE